MIQTLLLCLLVSTAAGAVQQQGDLSGLDRAMKKADERIATSPLVSYRNLESFIVWSGGMTRFEKYYNGTVQGALHQIQSQTKSIVSLLMGIAIDRGFARSEQEAVSLYFPGSFNAEDDPMKSSVTIRDLLTMSAGFRWEEMLPFDDPDNDNMNMYNSGKYLSYALSRPMDAKPSSEFRYNSGCPMITAGIIEKASKMPLDVFAEKFLFQPLGIDEFRWIKDSTGFCHAGGGLFLSPSDMLKIGVLVLGNGRWGDRQIVPETWITKSIQPCFRTTVSDQSYGFGWWIQEMSTRDDKTTRVISAQGAGGQYMYIIPEFDLVVSFTEHNTDTPIVGPFLLKAFILPSL
jgi:CubicO group peptidase (beta-lactamase class C family)